MSRACSYSTRLPETCCQAPYYTCRLADPCCIPLKNLHFDFAVLNVRAVFLKIMRSCRNTLYLLDILVQKVQSRFRRSADIDSILKPLNQNAHSRWRSSSSVVLRLLNELLLCSPRLNQHWRWRWQLLLCSPSFCTGGSLLPYNLIRLVFVYNLLLKRGMVRTQCALKVFFALPTL